MSLIARLAILATLTTPATAQPLRGSLAANDPVRPGGAFYDAYEFDAEQDEIVTVRMEATTFDTYLIVRSPSGAEQISDDFDGTMISQVELVAPEAGRWVAWASSYSAGTEGDYTLSIRRHATRNTELIQGRLDRQDAQALKGEYFDTHHFTSDGDGQVLFQLTSLGFDGYLVVTSPDGTITRVDGATAENLHVGPLAGVRGRWRVDVTSQYAGMVGAYDLRFVTFDRDAGQ
jgi:hypothetical protein